MIARAMPWIILGLFLWWAISDPVAHAHELHGAITGLGNFLKGIAP